MDVEPHERCQQAGAYGHQHYEAEPYGRDLLRHAKVHGHDDRIRDQDVQQDRGKLIHHRAHHDLKQQDRAYHHQRRRALVVDHSGQYRWYLGQRQ